LRHAARGVAFHLDGEAFVWIEFGWNECQASRAVERTRPMLGGGGRGEAIRQIVSPGAPGEDVTTQRRKAVVLAAEDLTDLTASPDRPFRDTDFSF